MGTALGTRDGVGWAVTATGAACALMTMIYMPRPRDAGPVAGEVIELPRTEGRVAARIRSEVGSWGIALTVAAQAGPECAGRRRGVGDWYVPALFEGGAFKATVVGRAATGERRYLLDVEGEAADACVTRVLATPRAVADLVRQTREARAIVDEGGGPEAAARAAAAASEAASAAAGRDHMPRARR